MIRLTVVTEILFADERKLFAYLESDDLAKITGFGAEVREAFLAKRPIKVQTPRIEHGTVSVSEIICEAIHDAPTL